jgi:hypothetical protein
MCLNQIDWNAKSRAHPKNRDKWLVGYKVMSIDHGNPFGYDGIFYEYISPIAYNEILKAKGTTQIYSDGISYHYGFHILKTIEDAKKYTQYNNNRVIFKVEYRKIVAQGIQVRIGKLPCDVAAEMRFISIVEQPKEENAEYVGN